MIDTASPELPRRDLPTRAQAIVFALKVLLLRAARGWRNWREGLHALPRADAASFPHVISETRSPLWGEPGDAALQSGKVHNLRIAAHRLNGTLLTRGALFSFWRQLGPASRSRGFVPGRMLREGCLVPAVGGGLCQLSNVLYDLALQAGLEVVERWPHSRIVPGSAAALGRDATVAWNYVDLRLRAASELLLELRLSETELIARLRSRTPGRAAQRRPAAPAVLTPTANSCDSCEATACFRHRPAAGTRQRRAFLVAENWPEFQAHVQATRCEGALLALPLDGQRWRLPRYAWPTEGFAEVRSAGLLTLAHALAARRAAPTAAAQLQAQMRTARAWARRFAAALKPDMTELTVAQSLLPWLWLDGHLGGRRVHVLMTRMPLHELHAKLDAAAHKFPERHTLAEFRAPTFLVQAEQAALAHAASLITPHRDIASLFGERAKLLDWQLPAAGAGTPRPRLARIAFPGPTIARKGAYELREAARQLGLSVAPLGRHLETPDFWQGIALADAALHEVDAIVQPALIEDQPRLLLRALAAGVPVIATPACGLAPHPLLTLVPALDAEALVERLRGYSAPHEYPASPAAPA